MIEKINRESSTPIQQQLYSALKEWFITDFKPSQMLPTEIDIVNRFSVGRGTVRIALDLLTKEGIIYRTAGKGTFLAEDYSIRLKQYRIGIILSVEEFGASKARDYTWVHHMEMINGMFAESINSNITCELIPEETITPTTSDNYDGFILFRGISKKNNMMLTKPLTLIHYEIDLYGGIELITSHIVSCKYKHVAYIGSIQKGRLEIVNQTLAKDAGLMIEKNARIECGGSSEDGYSAALTLLSQVEEVDCIICSTDLRAIGVLQALRESNVAIPRDISVYGFDGIRKSEMSNPPLTTCQFNWKQPGLYAVKEIRAILDRRFISSYELPKGELIVRKSSKK